MNYEIIPKSEFDRILESQISYYNKLEIYAAMCRYNCFVSVKKAGSGHLGSSFSAMDIVVYLYLMELNTKEVGFYSHERDIYFSSKGHDVPGLYSVLFALGLLTEKELLSLRRLNGLDGHPDVSIKGIEANTGSLGMGISKGKGMAWAKKFLNLQGRIFVLTGDGEFQEGQIYESLQSTAHQQIENITVIIDRNQYQTDRMVDSVNSIEDLEEKVSSFGWFVSRCDGNNFYEIEKAIEESKRVIGMPKFIIADTTKGYGLSFMEHPIIDEKGEKIYNWHSGAPDDETYFNGIVELKNTISQLLKEFDIQPISYKIAEGFIKSSDNVTREYVTDAFGKTLSQIAETREDIIVLDGDLSADCKLRPFEKKFPDRFIENGIAEQDMVSMAGGLARIGLLPVVSSFASFLTSRANEQIYNNACEQTKIIYACHFAGAIPAGPGKSHQSVRDISLLGAIPNLTIIQPCNSEEMCAAVHYAVEESPENVALRMVIGPSPGRIELPSDYIFEPGIGTALTVGVDAIMFAYGPVMLHEALTASDLLLSIGFGLKVVNMPWLNRFNQSWLYEITQDYKKIIVLEDHSTFGGLGDQLLFNLSQITNLNGISFRKFGYDDYPVCGVPQEVLKYHKLDGYSLAKRIGGINIDNFHHEEVYTVEAPQ